MCGSSYLIASFRPLSKEYVKARNESDDKYVLSESRIFFFFGGGGYVCEEIIRKSVFSSKCCRLILQLDSYNPMSEY